MHLEARAHRQLLAVTAIPPLGGSLGALIIVDEAVANAVLIGFEAFSRSDCFEVPYAEFARLERPRVIAFAGGGERGERTPEAGAAPPA